MAAPSRSNVYVPNVYMPLPMYSVHNIGHNIFVQPSLNLMNQFSSNIFIPTPVHSASQSGSHSFMEHAFRPSTHGSNLKISMGSAEESS